MSPFSPSQLDEIFAMLDFTNTGSITRADLALASQAHPEAASILALLDIPQGRTWDKREFCLRVGKAFGDGSPLKKKRSRRRRSNNSETEESSSSGCGGSSPVHVLSNPSEPLLPVVLRIRSQLDELNLLQLESRTELTALLENRLSRFGEDLTRGVAGVVRKVVREEVAREREGEIEAVKERDRLKEEIRAMHDKERTKERQELSQKMTEMESLLRDARDETLQLHSRVLFLESTLATQEEAFHSSEDDNNILRERNCVLESQVQALETALEEERMKHSEVKRQAKEASEALENERMQLVIDRIELASEKDEVLKAKGEIKKRKMSAPTIVEEIEEAMEANESDFEAREQLIGENKGLIRSLQESRDENQRLQVRVKGLQEVNKQSKGMLEKLLGALPLGKRSKLLTSTPTTWAEEEGSGVFGSESSMEELKLNGILQC